jgi:hypothetical protein
LKEQKKLCLRVLLEIMVRSLLHGTLNQQTVVLIMISPTDTTHRLFLASLLLASKFLEEDMESDANNSPVASIPRLNGKRLRDLCGGIYTLKDINTFELSFLKLIKYRCWVDQDDVESFLRRNSVELQLY